MAIKIESTMIIERVNLIHDDREDDERYICQMSRDEARELMDNIVDVLTVTKHDASRGKDE